MLESLDPVADRDLFLRNRYRRPELPPPAEVPQGVHMTWHELQRQWDALWNKDRRWG